MATVLNGRIEGVLGALRECSHTSIPVKISLQMARTQKAIVDQLGYVQEVNNGLIKEHGENNDDGVPHIGPDMDGWSDYVKAHNELQGLEFELGEAYLLFVEGDVLSWSRGGTPVALAPNVLVDLDNLLVVVEDIEENEVESDD